MKKAQIVRVLSKWNDRCLLTACPFCNPCVRAELHRQKRARKRCSATLKGIQTRRKSQYKARLTVSPLLHFKPLTTVIPAIPKHLDIYITADSTVSVFWATLVQCCCVVWRLSLKATPNAPQVWYQLSHVSFLTERAGDIKMNYVLRNVFSWPYGTVVL